MLIKEGALKLFQVRWLGAIFFYALLAYAPAKFASSLSYKSPIERFTANFSKMHKTWTENASTVRAINKLFSDSLAQFYAINPHAIDSLTLRLENIMENAKGEQLASLECWDHYVDNKKLRVHVYAVIADTSKKLFRGNEYMLIGTLEKFDLREGAGYNKNDNSCDAGIITIHSEKIIHLRGLASSPLTNL
ncbi:MAG: hypothetical protein NVS9B7_04600 [Flavisolibacter sp.]